MACAVPDRRCVCGRPGGRTSLRAPVHARPSREALSPGAGATPATLWPLGLCVRDSAAFWVCRPRGAGEMDVAWRGLGGRRPGRSCVSARRPCVLRRGSRAPWWRQEPSVPRHERSCHWPPSHADPTRPRPFPRDRAHFRRWPHIRGPGPPARPGAPQLSGAGGSRAAGSWPRGPGRSRAAGSWPRGGCAALLLPRVVASGDAPPAPRPAFPWGFRHTARLSDAWPGG